MSSMRAWKGAAYVVAMACVLAGCRDDDDPAEGMATEAQTSDSSGGEDSSGPASTGPVPTGQDSTGETSGDGSDSTGSDSDDPIPPNEQIYEEQFEGNDGSPWPAPWENPGTEVISAELDDGRARFNGNTMNVARMVLPGFSETDVDVAFTVTYEDYYAQGVGFYARQNGGVLQQTTTFGQGYAVYIEGGFMQNIGIWRETNGVEEPLLETSIASMFLENGVPYRVRFECYAEGDQTRLRARLWPVGEDEPGSWLVDTVDSTPELQGTAGSFAADIYNYAGTASVYIDDVVISRLTPR